MVVVSREGVPSGTARWRAAGRHAESLFDHIESAMADADVSRAELSLIGVSIGPGGFTSLRVGLATAKGLSLGLGIPVVGVSSLRVLARSIEGDASAVRVPMLNAYRGDVFAAAFTAERHALCELVAPSFGPPEEVLSRIREVVGTHEARFGGEAASPNQGVIERVFGRSSTAGSRRADTATPASLLTEVLQVYAAQGPADLARLEPQYLRSSDAKPPEQRFLPGRSA